MSNQLLEKRVAILAADGFEQSELEGPMKALVEAGATVSIVSPKKDKIQGMHHADKGDRFDVLVTSMPSQQNLQSAGLALVMLVAISNSLEQLAPLVPALLAILPTVVPGQVYCVSSSTTP